MLASPVTLLLAVAVLGLSAGALLAEAAVLVPFWRSLRPESFLAWYRENGALLLRFFGPLEVAAALSVGLATAVRWPAGGPAPWLLLGSTLLSLLVLAAFPLYFQRANASFADGSLSPEGVPEALRRWARWHHARVAASGAAFVAAILAALSAR